MLMSAMQQFVLYMDEIWHKTFLGVTMGQYIEALISFIIVLVVGKIIIFIVLKYLKRFSEKGQNNFDRQIYSALNRPLNFLIVIAAIGAFVQHLHFTGSLGILADRFLSSLVTICFFWFVINLILPLDFLFKRWKARLSKPIVDWMIRFWRILLVFTAIASVLQIWGIKIGPMIAGLGLFSVALALGAQNLFKNLIAGIVILAERRFVIGERIAANGVDGVVEHIGFRSTRIRTLDKIPVYVPNSTFSDQALTNYAGQSNRKLNWNFGLVYGTTSKQLQTIVKELREYIKATPDFIYDDNVVYVTSFGDSSINILVNVLIVTADYTQFMRAQQNLIYKIMELVENNGSDFAFPSQSLYIEKLPQGAAAFPFGITEDGEYEIKDTATPGGEYKGTSPISNNENTKGANEA